MDKLNHSTKSNHASRITHHASHFPFPVSRFPLRGRGRGQSMVIIALSMVVLVAFVGLAVDGGSMYLQRRTAQNAVDGAALAGTRSMLEEWQDTIFVSGGEIVDGNANQEEYILSKITDYAAINGVISDTVTAYFVNNDKQVVSALAGAAGADGLPMCGAAVPNRPPCPVGLNNSVPWSMGATGINVTGQATAESFFIGLIGFETVSASADATAYMGPAVSPGTDQGLLPIGFFTHTYGLDRLVPGQEYTLMRGDTRYEPGNWGWVAFNGNGSANVADAWIDCGYNPTLETQDEWNRWCPRQRDVQAYGPTIYWTGWPLPDNTAHTSYTFRWGRESQGWWLRGSTGTVNSNCQDLQQAVRNIVNRNPPDFLIPIFDAMDGVGNNTKYHLLNLAWFRITNAEVHCHRVDQGPPRVVYSTWNITGRYIQKYAGGAFVRRGDLMGSSLHGVFLDP